MEHSPLEMSSSYFGPGVWIAAHTYAANLPHTAEAGKGFIFFMETNINMLPCPVCRGHAQTYLKENPLVFSEIDPQWAFKWGFIFHNAVNKRLGKPRLTYNEAFDRYRLRKLKKRYGSIRLKKL